MNQTTKQRTITPKHDVDIKGEPVKADGWKWRNISFDKSGKQYTGQLIHDSKGAAHAANKKAIKNCLNGHPGIDEIEGRLLFKNYSHTIQMPVRE
jgi:hypothetical protein